MRKSFYGFFYFEEMITMNSKEVYEDFFEDDMDKREEAFSRIEMKKHAGIFIISTFLYTLFYSWFVQDISGGVMVGVFQIVSIFYFCFAFKWMGKRFSKWQIVFPVSMGLLAVSYVITDSNEIYEYNKLMGIALIGLFAITVMNKTTTWRLGDFMIRGLAFFLGGLCHMEGLFVDIKAIFERKQLKEAQNEKKSKNIKSVLIGILFGLPITLVMMQLLSASDMIFANMLKNIPTIHLSDRLATVVFFTCLFGWYLYSVMYNCSCEKKEILEKEKKKFNSVIAITMFTMLTVLYISFSVVQLLGLILQKMQLPKGYTYAEYARSGFFVLLFVCALNVVFVIFGKTYFKEHWFLKMLLNTVCGCTIIMIIASALKMSMYIDAYGFTRLRYKVVIALVVVSLGIIGTILWINLRHFPLLAYSAAVILVAYLFYALSMPDYRIAKYNLEHFGETGFYSVSNVWETSMDAIPAMVSYQEEHPKVNILGEFEATIVEQEYAEMGWRDANISVYKAKKRIEEIHIEK